MDDPKQNILAAASELFLEGGIDALSVRGIAARAGISTIGIYSHFQGKQGILDALYVEGFQRVSAAMDVAIVEGNSKAAVLKACRNYLDSAERFEAHYQLIFGRSNKAYQPSIEAKKVGAYAFNVLNDLVATLLPANASKAQRHDAAMQVWSVIHGFVSLKHHAVAQLVDMRFWRARAMKVLDVVLDGIADGRLS